MKVFQYKDYDHYVQAQTNANRKKINWVYVRENVIKAIAQEKGNAESVICHGTRNGAEQKYFLGCYPDAYIIGTEISPTASDFDMTVQWDFTEQKEEWVGAFDIVYSNSFDHSITPVQTLETWRDQLNQDGMLFLEYSESQSVGDVNDPLDATLSEVIDMCARVGLELKTRLKVKAKNSGVVLVLQR